MPFINQNNEIHYKTSFFKIRNHIELDEITFNSFDHTLMFGINRAEISSVANAIRRFAELEAAKDIINELNNNDIILIDGDLKASMTNETTYLDELYKKAIEKNITISALSKTSELFTDKGNALIPVLNEISPAKEGYYYPLVKINNNDHKADIHIVKLNKNSKYYYN